MAPCELCGKQDKLVTAIVEGTELNVCENCGKYGKIIRKPVLPKKEFVKTKTEPEIVEKVMSDYSKKIREARQAKNMTQEEFAKMLNEKESIIQKIETGTFKPSIDLARKLEKKLGITLIEKDETVNIDLKKGNTGTLTIGDLIKIKK